AGPDRRMAASCGRRERPDTHRREPAAAGRCRRGRGDPRGRRDARSRRRRARRRSARVPRRAARRFRGAAVARGFAAADARLVGRARARDRRGRRARRDRALTFSCADVLAARSSHARSRAALGVAAIRNCERLTRARRAAPAMLARTHHISADADLMRTKPSTTTISLRVALLAAAAGAALSACSPEPRTYEYFLADKIARDGVLARCDADPVAARADIECAQARRAALAV